MNTLYIDIHILQSVPPSCINRDDSGSPKTAVYGGVRRARVSSQAWKRAARSRFPQLLDADNLGIRTKKIVDLVIEQIRAKRADLDSESTVSLAEAVVTAAGLNLKPSRKENAHQESEYLLLVSRQQAATLAQLALDIWDEHDDAKSAVAALSKEKKLAKQALGSGNSVDLALFGRMVANDTDLNVDAACQVAHAISVHAAANEFDYFTAVDDLKLATTDDETADAGAGMLGTIEFTSATLYRYASINVMDLARNLGDSAMTTQGIEAFIKAFVLSMPTGKVNTFANNTLPEAVVVAIRRDQPVSWVGAFENPVQAKGGFVVPAAEALVKWAEYLHNSYGAADQIFHVGVGPVVASLSGFGEAVSFSELTQMTTAAIRADLPENP